LTTSKGGGAAPTDPLVSNTKASAGAIFAEAITDPFCRVTDIATP